MRAVPLAAMLILVILAGCFGGGKGTRGDKDDDGTNDGTGGGDGGAGTEPSSSRTGSKGSTTRSTTTTGTGSTTTTGTGGPGDGTTAPRTPDVWFNGSRMDLSLKGTGAVLDAILEATVGFVVQAAVVTQDPAVMVAMVPETPSTGSCSPGVDGPLVASGQPWLDAMGMGPRPAGRFRFVYQAPASASIKVILGDVTLDNAPVEVTGQATNATIEVRSATWPSAAPGDPRTATDTFTIAGRVVLAAGSRMDYDAVAGERSASNDVDVDGAACVQGERPVAAGAGLAGSLEHSVAAIVRDSEVHWQGTLEGAYVGGMASGGVIVVHLND